jgi:hypothetical protein
MLEELAQLVAALWAYLLAEFAARAAVSAAEAPAVVLVRAAAQDPDAPWTAVEPAGTAARLSLRRC